MKYGKMKRMNLGVAASLTALTLLACCLCGCSNRQRINIESNTTDFYLEGSDDMLKLVVIDGCEYLYGPWGNATVLTHKGNCKNHTKL